MTRASVAVLAVLAVAGTLHTDRALGRDVDAELAGGDGVGQDGVDGLRQLLGGHPSQSRAAPLPPRHPFRCGRPGEGWYSFTLLPP